MNPITPTTRDALNLVESLIHRLSHVTDYFDRHHAEDASDEGVINQSREEIAEAEKELKAALATPEAQGWRGMESAPRDGTMVLLWWPEWRNHPIIGHFATGSRGKYWYATGVLTAEGEPPTHWQPLAPPPLT